jgi:hypothetical protein
VRGSRRLAGIEGLRAIAAASIVVYHVYLYSASGAAAREAQRSCLEKRVNVLKRRNLQLVFCKELGARHPDAERGTLLLGRVKSTEGVTHSEALIPGLDVRQDRQDDASDLKEPNGDGWSSCLGDSPGSHA